MSFGQAALRKTSGPDNGGAGGETLPSSLEEEEWIGPLNHVFIGGVNREDIESRSQVILRSSLHYILCLR